MNNELYEKLTRLQWLLHIQQMDSYRRGEHLTDTSRGQGRILAALQMKDGISTKDLSYLLGLAVSSLNEFLAKLEKAGYITREPSEQDKRISLVKLTEKGKSRQGLPDEAVDPASIFDCLTEAEQTTLESFLDRMIESMGEKLGFGADELDWLKAASAERGRMIAEMGEAGARNFDPHNFRGGFDKYPRRRGYPEGRESFNRGRDHDHNHHDHFNSDRFNSDRSDQ